MSRSSLKIKISIKTVNGLVECRLVYLPSNDWIGRIIRTNVVDVFVIDIADFYLGGGQVDPNAKYHAAKFTNSETGQAEFAWHFFSNSSYVCIGPANVSRELGFVILTALGLGS